MSKRPPPHPAPDRGGSGLRWRRYSDWSIRADGRPYAVSRTVGPYGERFSAWHGEPLEPGRRDIPMPTLLGIYRTADEARESCRQHHEDHA
jgi:hypothetical protein